MKLPSEYISMAGARVCKQCGCIEEESCGICAKVEVVGGGNW